MGSFNCTCLSGYAGNGTTCVGEYQLLLFYSYKARPTFVKFLETASNPRLPCSARGGLLRVFHQTGPQTFTGKRPGDPGDKVGFIFTRSRDLTSVFWGIVLVQF